MQLSIQILHQFVWVYNSSLKLEIRETPITGFLCQNFMARHISGGGSVAGADPVMFMPICTWLLMHHWLKHIDLHNFYGFPMSCKLLIAIQIHKLNTGWTNFSLEEKIFVVQTMKCRYFSSLVFEP